MTPSRSHQGAIGFVSFFSLLLVCTRLSAQVQATDVLSSWLSMECEVGQEGQVEAELAQLGAPLAPALAQAAQHGPDPSFLANAQNAAGRGYDQLVAFLESDRASGIGFSPGEILQLRSLTRDQFVADYVGRAVTGYRAHALTGLGIVGGPIATQVLETFAKDSTSPYLQSVAQAALRNLTGDVIPNVVGETQAAATTAITAAGLKVGAVRTQSSMSVPKGHVVSESPPAGTVVAAGSSVALTVSLPGDLNGDGVVSCADLDVIKASFGKKAGQPGFDIRADVNGDGVVNILDLSEEAKLMPAGTQCN